MKRIQWDEGLSVGNPALDADHRQFIALLNRLIDLIDESPDAEQIHEILDELERLALAHNRHEERLLKKAGGRLWSKHRREHDEFRAAVVEARGQLSSEDFGSSLIDMTEFLVKLTVSHIIDQDLDFAETLSGQETKKYSLAEYLVAQFQKISFVRGLEMLIVVSLLPMLIFAGMVMHQAWQGAVKATAASELAGYSAWVGDLAHELQKERGLSAGFLTSEDRAFGIALRLQRSHSDRQLRRFVDGVANRRLEGPSAGIGEQAARVIVRLEALGPLRKDVDSARVPARASFDRYTALISELTELTNQIAIVSRKQDASELFQANAILIQFTEMAGRERAIVAAGFGRGEFTHHEYRQLVAMTSEQRSLQQQFRSFVSADYWRRWQEHFSDNSVADYQRLSDYALEYGSGNGQVEVDGFTWFKVATQRINLVQQFQQLLIKDLLSAMKRQRSRSTALFMTTVFGGGAMVLLIGFVALQLAKSIRLPILSLTRGMRALTADDRSVRIPFARRKDELGDMVAAYEAFRRKLIRTNLLTLGEELGPLATNRHALALKRRTAEGEEYKRLASIDSLTGVLNRREFMRRAKVEVSRLRRHHGQLAVLLLDVDFFKQVNDNFGHPAGDRVLKITAQTICSALREEDVLGRIGGEEFAAFLPATDEQAAKVTAERVRAAIEGLRIQVGEREVAITLSIGLSEFVSGEVSIEAAMGRADKALYQAKNGGRNRVCGYAVSEALS